MKKSILILIVCLVVAGVAWWLHSRRLPSPASQTKGPEIVTPQGGHEPVGSIGTNGGQPHGSANPTVSAKSRLTAQQILSGMDMPENIRTIAGLTPDKSYQGRTKAVQGLGKELSRKDLDGIYAFLAARYEDYKGELTLLEFESIRNDTLDALLRQKELPPDLGKKILAMYQDREQNDVWRDYCVQHFAPYAKVKWKDGFGASNDTEWVALTNAYWQATTETKTTIAGTALIGMNSLAGRYPGMSKDQVEGRALQLAEDDTCGDASRVTAFRMCAQLGRKEVLPSARIVSQVGSSIHLRMAAAATVGDLGDKSDLELLQSIAAGTEPRMKPIADAAMKRIDDRLAKLERASK